MNEINLIAEQLVHDIRSPLFALEIISASIHELPEEKRAVIKSSIDRIRGITNSLIQKNKDSTEPLLKSLESVIREKKVRFHQHPALKIEFLHSTEMNVVCKIPAHEMKRVLSNLIDNAVESLPSFEGHVTILLTTKGNQNIICIVDNGKGIPAHRLGQIGKRGITIGKKGGSGLGLYHAIETLGAWNGTLVIQSRMNQGTTITITVPNNNGD